MKHNQRWHDGVELFLDNRQIFMLFFASAMALSLVFALGVVVGKRMERQTVVKPAADPLAMLDQLGSAESLDDNLTFHERLTGAQGTPPENEAADVRAEPDNRPSQAPLNVVPEPEPQEPTRSPNTRTTDEKMIASAKHPPVLSSEPRREQAKREQAKGEQSKGEQAKREQAKGEQAKSEPNASLTESQPSKISSAAAGEPGSNAKSSGKYTLQLSSFQDRHEAELFMRKLRGSGMRPYLMPASIPGRGVWFRVRIGAFESWDEALAAKEVFEREQQIVAYVAKN